MPPHLQGEGGEGNKAPMITIIAASNSDLLLLRGKTRFSPLSSSPAFPVVNFYSPPILYYFFVHRRERNAACV